jgi:PAS domain S-box-containing protein
MLSREITAQIRAVLEEHPQGLSITDLVKSVDINRNTAGRYLERMLLSGQVEMRRFGMAKMYTLAERLPVSSVLSISLELVLQLDFSQRILYANDTLLTFLDVPAKALIGKHIEFTPFPVVFEEVFPELLDRFRRGLRGEEWHGELSRPVRDTFFFCRVAPTVSNEGTKSVSVLLEDITNQKRDEERIRASEARLRSIFMVSPVGIGVVADRVLLEVNDRFCRMTGYSPAELVGKSVRMFYLSEEEFSRAGALYIRQIRQSGAGSIETQWVKKDGTVIDILVNTTPLDPANISGGITFTALDITKRKQAEHALRASEAKLHLALSASETGMWEMDFPAGKGSIDEGAAAILGCAGDAIGTLQTDWDILSHPDDVPLIKERITDYLEGRTSMFVSEHRMRHCSGRWIWVLGRGKVTQSSQDGSCKRISGTLKDITARKEAEQALRESEEKYRHVVEESLQGLTIIRDGRPVYANPAMLEIGGFSSMDEYLALSARDMLAAVHPDDRDRIRRVMADRLAGKDVPAGNEFRILRKDGQVRWVLTRAARVEYNNAPAIQVTYFDITKRRTAEEALRESEDRYRKLVEISPNAIILHQDGKILYVNPELVRILGARDTGELIGRAVLEIVHPEYRQALKENIRRDLTGEHTPVMELQVLRTDGTPVMIEGRGVSTMIGGRPAVLVALNDITERYRAGQVLEKSQKMYRTLAEASRDLIFVFDRDDRVEYVNSCAAASLGRPADQVIGQQRALLFPGEPGQHQAQALRRVFETGKSGRSEGILEMAGTPRWFDHYLIPVTDTDGRVTSVLGVSRDITDRKKAEDALRASEERYRCLLGQMFDAVAVCKDKKIAFINKRGAHILGAESPQDLVGRPIADLIHPDSRADIEERIRMTATAPSKPAPVLREPFLRVDGTVVTVEAMVVGTRDNGIPAVRVMFREVPVQQPEHPGPP